MNPSATGASAGHAPLEGATKSTRRERAENRGRFAKMRRRGRKTARRDTRADLMKRKEGKGEKESKWRQKGGQAERPWLGDLYRIISPSERLHF